MALTWALFVKRGEFWELAELTPHDERALEFQETMEEQQARYAICILED